MSKRAFGLWAAVIFIGVLAGCGRPTGEVTDGAVEVSVTATAASAVVEASPTPVPPTALVETPVPDTPTDTPVPPVATTVPPTAAPLCRTVQNLNLRDGPGLSYNPPIRTLQAGAPLTPLAFSATGFPDGQWVRVRDDAAGDEGWVSAAAQFVSCAIDVTTLPQADFIPPTPTPLPQPTATIAPATGGAPRVSNSAPGGTAAAYAEGEVLVSDDFLFRMRILDTRKGGNDGDGIDFVEFFIRTEDFDEIYSRRENHAGYCIFGGGEPDCNTWPQRDGKYVWGDGGPEVQPGTYFVSILVTPKDQDFEGEVWNWDFDFTVTLP